MDGDKGSSAPPVLHPAVEPLSFLLGSWKGEGEGGFPTINSFSYGEELHFSHSGNKPVVGYTQKTWKLNSGEPMHAESGYWRPKPDGSIEVVIAQSTGLVEVQILIGGSVLAEPAQEHLDENAQQKGTYDAKEKVIELQSETVGNASKVREIRRLFKLVDGNLCYEVQMATNTVVGLQPHLKAALKKL